MSRQLTEILTSRRAKKAYLVLALALTLLLVCDNVFMPWLVGRSGVVEVPNVSGVKLERAKTILDSLSLQAREGEVRPDLHFLKGTVISQVPFAGTKVRPGRRVYLSISGGEPVAEVPSLKGRSLRDAAFALDRSGLALGGTSYAPSDEFPPNTIIEQGVSPGSTIRKGSAVSVVVSQGKETDRIAVPSVVGRILQEAEKLLVRHGLKVGNITDQESLELLPSTVLDQYPRGGELVSLGQPIDLFVVRSGGKKPKETLEN